MVAKQGGTLGAFPRSGVMVAPFADGSADIDFAYWIVWPKWRTPSKLARAFMAWLKAEAAAGEVTGV